MSSRPEVWLRGPLPGIPPLLMPAAHAFVQVSEELAGLVAGMPEEKLWEDPGGAATIAFHLRHIAGATGRLLTYARGETLSAEQSAVAATETAPRAEGETAEALLSKMQSAIDAALEQLRRTPVDSLLEPRSVGRQRLPSTVLGLLFHAAEHAQRHCGQAATTARLLRR